MSVIKGDRNREKAIKAMMSAYYCLPGFHMADVYDAIARGDIPGLKAE